MNQEPSDSSFILRHLRPSRILFRTSASLCSSSRAPYTRVTVCSSLFCFSSSRASFLLSEFLPVTDLELLPFGRIVAEPLAQLRARGHVLQPQIHRRALFGQAARPQAIDQDSQAVLSGRLFVNSLHWIISGILLCVGWWSGTGPNAMRSARQCLHDPVPKYDRLSRIVGEWWFCFGGVVLQSASSVGRLLTG